MAKDFDDWMEEQFPLFGEEKCTGDGGMELSAEFCTLCAEQKMPIEAVMHLLALLMDVWRPLARLQTVAEKCAANSYVGPDFPAELMKIIQRHVAQPDA